MNVPGTEISNARAGGLAYIKFSLYIFSFLILTFCLLQIPKKNIKTNNTLFWFSIYLLTSSNSLIVYWWQTGIIDAISWSRLIGLWFFIPYFWVLRHLKTKNILQIIYISKLIPITIIGFLYIVSKDSVMRTIWVVGEQSTQRLGGNVIPPNTLGGMLAIAILLTIVILKNKNTLQAILISLLIFMLYLTQSRTAIMALLSSLTIGYILAFRNITARIKFFIALIFAVASIPAIYENIIIANVRFQTGLSTLGGRLTLWEQAYTTMESSTLLNLFFGFGFMLPNSWFHTGGLTTNSLHNGYLQVLFGTGLIGLCAYLLIWYSLIITNQSKKTLQTFTFYSLFSFLLLFNISELGPFVLVNSMSLVFIALISFPIDKTRSNTSKNLN